MSADFNARLKMFCELQGISIHDLTVLLRIKRSTFDARYYADKPALTVHELKDLHEIKGVNLNWLILGIGEMTITEKPMVETVLTGPIKEELGTAEFTSENFRKEINLYKAKNRIKSFSEVAKRMNHTYTHLMAVMNGEKHISIVMATKAVNTLGIDANKIFKKQ